MNVNNIEILSNEQLIKIQNKLRELESTNVYTCINKFGYIGAYQFGVSMLKDLKYINNFAKTNKCLLKSESWTGKNNCYNINDWLNNKNIQDQALIESLFLNFKYLKSKKAIKENINSKELAGLLMAAHLVGAGGANQLMKQNIICDSNGTSSLIYYNIGYNLFDDLVASTANLSAI